MDFQDLGKPDSHVLLVSGPGTGKTHWIKRRIEFLLNSGFEPQEIVCITFTCRASLELKERISELSGSDGLFIGTIHSLGLKLLQKNSLSFKRIIDREEQISILKGLLGDEKLARNAQRRIEIMKNSLRFEDDPLLRAYEENLRAHNLLDFEDLILKPLLNEISFERDIKHIIVDEFQDLNRSQYELIKKISKICKSFVSACGDPDQSIYGFRGSDPSIFLNFERDFPDCQRLTLKENYRSFEHIIASSQGLISNNNNRFPVEIYPKRKGGPKVKIVDLERSWMAPKFIASKIEEMLGGLSNIKATIRRAETDFSFSDFAVLFRTNREAFEIKDSLEKAGIPCRVIGERFDESSISKIRGHIESVISKEGEPATELKVSDFFNLYPMDLEPSVLKLLIRFLEGRRVSDFYSELLLLSPMDDYDFQQDSVTLTTIHRAKGLEFRVVFVTSLNDGLIPLKNEDLEEERRLLYVAMTRAKDELFLIKSRDLPSSPFLKEIPKSSTEYMEVVKKEKVVKRRLL